jgi:hypothetical protein
VKLMKVEGGEREQKKTYDRFYVCVRAR